MQAYAFGMVVISISNTLVVQQFKKLYVKGPTLFCFDDDKSGINSGS